jgi:hypothetical protein
LLVCLGGGSYICVTKVEKKVFVTHAIF